MFFIGWSCIVCIAIQKCVIFLPLVKEKIFLRIFWSIFRFFWYLREHRDSCYEPFEVLTENLLLCGAPSAACHTQRYQEVSNVWVLIILTFSFSWRQLWNQAATAVPCLKSLFFCFKARMVLLLHFFWNVPNLSILYLPNFRIENLKEPCVQRNIYYLSKENKERHRKVQSRKAVQNSSLQTPQNN